MHSKILNKQEEEHNEDQQIDAEEQLIPTAVSSFSSIEAVNPFRPCIVNDFKAFQDLMMLELEQEKSQNQLDILLFSMPGRFAMPINEELLQPSKELWQTPTSIPAIYKEADKHTKSLPRVLSTFIHIWCQDHSS